MSSPAAASLRRWQKGMLSKQYSVNRLRLVAAVAAVMEHARGSMYPQQLNKQQYNKAVQLHKHDNICVHLNAHNAGFQPQVRSY
jgi:hypothetical protein